MLAVPSLFPDTGGISEFFPNNYQFMYKQYDYEDLKIKIKQFLNNSNLDDIGIQNKNYIKNKLNKMKLINQINKRIID